MATAAPLRSITASSRSAIDYWHLLSLDAPTIAGLWSCALCRAAHVTIPVPAVVLITFGAWLLYVGDRILDSINPTERHRLRERHHFHRAHRWAFIGAGFAVVWALPFLAQRVPERMLSELAMVLIAALAYFALVHGAARAVAQSFPKELAVGIIFAAAVSVPAWSQIGSWVDRLRFAPEVSLLAALCWLNCLSIECWESAIGVSPKAGSGGRGCLTWRSGSHIQRIAVMIAMSVTALVVLETVKGVRVSPAVLLPVLVSAGLLFYLDHARSRFAPLRLRIAADAALLTPVLFMAGFGPR